MSGCRAEIWLDRVPVEAALVTDFGAAWPDLALGGGEDFELVITVPEASSKLLLEAWTGELAPLSVAGRLLDGAGVVVLESEGGAPIQTPQTSSRHFA
jgi:thiamine-monophosphate kinase